MADDTKTGVGRAWLAAVVLLCGCEATEDLKSYAHQSAETSTAQTATTTSTDSATDDIALVVAPPRIPVISRAEGSTADANKETDNFGNKKIWVDGAVSLSVRCLANDEDGHGYFCDSIVSDHGGLKMYKNGDGSVTAVGSDFVSPRTGLIYQFQGFRAVYSSSSMIRSNPYVLTKDKQTGTFRAYWETYR